MRFLPVAIALSLLLSNAWATGPTAPFNIPAMNVREALIAFQAQSPIDIFFYGRGESINGISTHPVVGEFKPADALAKMLEGTGLVYEAVQLDTGEVLKIHENSGQTGSAEDERFLKLHAAEQQTFGSGTQLPQEVVVTGSLIRGLDSITAPVFVVSKTEKNRAAYGTVQDVLRTLPFSFGGGANEDFSTGANFIRGAAINLRGLGSGATLVLVNGRRQPASGMRGDFVDVTTIPWSAVQRIEVLTDGASASYGSDAVAGVVNIILRDDIDGIAETQTRLGSSPGGADETLAAQLFGQHWNGGKWLAGYQYSERTSLAAAERSYAANADKRPFGGSDLRTYSSNPGNILDPFTQRPAYAIPAGQDGKSLNAEDLLPGVVNLQNQLELRDLLPDRSTHSAFFTASQKFVGRIDLFAEGRFSSRTMSATERGYTQQLFVPDSNPFFVSPVPGMPFVIVAYNFLNEFGPINYKGTTETYTGTLGLKVDMTRRWQAALSGYYGREDLNWKGYGQPDLTSLNLRLADPDRDTAFNPFGAGSNTNRDILESLLYVQREQAISQVKTISLKVDGPLADLAVGTPKLALGFDQRTESLFQFQTQGRDATASGEYERKIVATFAELAMPLGSRLNLSLAGRYEQYSDFGSTFNPKMGLRWTVNDSFRFRGSWGTSFRAPTLVDLYDHSQDTAAIFPLSDPHSPTGFSLVLGEAGTNPNLHEEKAKTWTVGTDFSPSVAPGFILSSTYYAIHYDDQIFRYPLTLPLESLLADDKWAPLVIRNPSRSDIERICSIPQFVGLRSDCLTSSPAAILDLRLRNLSATTIKGIDVDLKHALQTNYGGFNLGLSGSYILSFEQTITHSTPPTDLAGIVLNPVALRLRGTVDWHQHGRNRPGLGASLATDYLDSSRDDNGSTATHISASTTFDLQLNYRTENTDALLGNAELILNAVNIFNRNPPFVNREEGYDPINARPYGRVISINVQKNW